MTGEVAARGALGPGHLERLGRELARVHLSAQSFGPRRERTPTLEQLERELEGAATGGDCPSTRESAREARALLARARTGMDGLAPGGIVHGDVRPTHVRWVGDQLSALYGFEEACHEPYAGELGAVLDAWCFDAVTGSWDAACAHGLLSGYAEVRPLQAVERHNLWGHASIAAVCALTARLGLPGASGALVRVRSLARLDPAAFLARAAPGA
jgi:homoserine kinase type II